MYGQGTVNSKLNQTNRNEINQISQFQIFTIEVKYLFVFNLRMS